MYGVDTTIFSPAQRTRNIFVITTVKGLEKVYGIDILLKAVQIVRNEWPEIPLRVRIAGRGSREDEYKRLVEVLDITDIVSWLGFIPQEEVAMEWANADIAVIPSRNESFGVSAVEAEASGTPVLITDVPGLREATIPGKTSIVIKNPQIQNIAEMIVKLYFDDLERSALGIEGRKFVMQSYEINNCFHVVQKFYAKHRIKK